MKIPKLGSFFYYKGAKSQSYHFTVISKYLPRLIQKLFCKPKYGFSVYKIFNYNIILDVILCRSLPSLSRATLTIEKRFFKPAFTVLPLNYPKSVTFYTKHAPHPYYDSERRKRAITKFLNSN